MNDKEKPNLHQGLTIEESRPNFIICLTIQFRSKKKSNVGLCKNRLSTVKLSCKENAYKKSKCAYLLYHPLFTL